MNRFLTFRVRLTALVLALLLLVGYSFIGYAADTASGQTQNEISADAVREAVPPTKAEPEPDTRDEENGEIEKSTQNIEQPENIEETETEDREETEEAPTAQEETEGPEQGEETKRRQEDEQEPEEDEANIPEEAEEMIEAEILPIAAELSDLLDMASPQDIRNYFEDGQSSILVESWETGGREYHTQAKYFDDGGNELDPSQPIPVDATIQLDFCFRIPYEVAAQIQAGDYYAIALHAAVNMTEYDDIVLMDGFGQTYGTVVFEKNTAVITFTEAASEVGALEGYFFVRASWDADEITPGKVVEIFDGDQDIPVPGVVVRPKGSASISKEALLPDNTYQMEAIAWKVLFNTEMNQMKNPVIKDALPKELSFDAGDITVYRVKVDIAGNLLGDESSWEDVTALWNAEVADNTLILSLLPDGRNGADAVTMDAFCVIINSQVTDAALAASEQAGELTFKNTASLNADTIERELTATAEVTGSYGKTLEKQQAAASDGESNTGVYTWTIAYNYNKKTVPAGTLLADFLMDNKKNSLAGIVQLKNLVVEEVLLSEAGEKTAAVRELEKDADYEILPGSALTGDLADALFVIRFLKEQTGAMMLTYTVELISPIQDTFSYVNEVEIWYNGGKSGSCSQTGTISQRIVRKSYTAVDYQNKRITWEAVINRNGYALEPELVITDTLLGTHAVDFSTIAVYRLDKVISGGVWTGAWSAETKIEDGYTLKEAGNGFEITISNPGDASYRVAYQTTYDSAYAAQLHNGTFANEIHVKWKTGGKEHESSASASITPRVEARENGWKGGEYDARANTITWEIGLNYNSLQVKKLEFSDLLESPQVLREIEIYRYSVQANGEPVREEKITDLAAEGIVMESMPAAGGTLVTITIGDGSAVVGRYIAVITGALEGEVSKKINNTAKISHDYNEDSVSATVDIWYGGEIAAKSGAQDVTGFANWNIWINRSQSTLSEVEIHDILSDNQTYKADTIKLWRAGVNAANKDFEPQTVLIENEDYTLTIEEVTTYDAAGHPLYQHQEMVIEMIGDYETFAVPLYLTYQTYVSGEWKDIISNEIQISNDQTVYADSGGKNTIDVTEGEGFAQGKRQFLRLMKTDENGQALAGTTLYLESAQARIYKTLADKEEPGVFDVQTYLANGDYAFTIYELTAHEGYTIPEALTRGIPFTVRVNDAGYTILIDAQYQDILSFHENGDGFLHIVNQPSVVSMRKTDAAGGVIQGVQIALERNDGDAWTEIQLFETDEWGDITIYRLPAGHYRFAEKRAEGYLINTEPLYFLMYADAQGRLYPVHADASGAPVLQDAQVVPVNAENPLVLINYRSSVSFIKTAKDESPLAGAVFSLYRGGQSEALLEGIVSGEDGVVYIENLAPGNYYFEETKSPAGYRLSSQRLEFIIPEEWAGEPEALELGAFINTKSSGEKPDSGEVRLNKTDESGRPLQGAQFALYRAGEAEPVMTGETDASGMLVFTGLTRGSYYLKETKAPEGYLRNSEADAQDVLSFTLTSSTQIFHIGTYTNYQGSVRFRKADTGGASLAGAEFALYRKDTQEVVAAGLVSGEDGMVEVTGLAPGSYYFTETKAPEGYERNAMHPDLAFRISETYPGKPEVIVLKDFINGKAQAGGSIRLFKTDEQGKALQGAVFDLYNRRTGEVVYTGLETAPDGVLALALPAPGEYYFVETKAPAGYRLDETPVYFTVSDLEETIRLTVKNEPAIPEPGGEMPGGETPDPVPEPGDGGSTDTPGPGTDGPGDGSTPPTGDTTPSLIGYLVLLLAGLAGAAALILFRKRIWK